MSDAIEACAAAAAELERVYRHVEVTAMADVPILNKALSVQCVGMTSTGAGKLCVLITPWFINLVLLPDGVSPPVQPGTKTKAALPGGVFEFIQSHHEEIGPYRMCSLLSPVFEFEAQADALTVAEAILAEVLAPQETEDLEDSDMVAVWEGRLPQINAVEQEEAHESPDALEIAQEPKLLSRRAMFGLRPTEEVAP